MCGIVGWFDTTASLDREKCVKGLNSIAHRGPDNESFVYEPHYFLGHRRLSILDLSDSAHQPMQAGDPNVTMVYNGEVYNFQELRKELLADQEFQTSSDTEVILRGYITYGRDFFKKLRGIYAIGIYDKREDEKILLVRDPGGIKPLYIYRNENKIGFASEIKALKPAAGKLTVNEDCLKAYLNLGYCPEPQTIYKEITALNPGTILEFSRNGISESKFFEYDFGKTNNKTFEENLALTEEHLSKAISKNLIADVDIAVALSGGVDSSLAYYYANQAQPGILGLTVKFNDEEYDESSTATRFAQSVNGKQEIIGINNDFNLEVLNKILLNFDQPYADSSAIPVYYLTKASSQYSKVLVGGDGGDELYNGYPSQTWLAKMHQMKSNGLMDASGKFLLSMGGAVLGGHRKRLLERFKVLWNDQPEDMLYDWHSWFPRSSTLDGKSAFKFADTQGIDLYKSLLSEEEPSDFKGQVVFDYFRKTMLGDYLRKTDMMSMLNGVEYRVPILDEDLVSLALNIPFEQKSALKKTKIFLRKIHEKAYPPETSNAGKKGFTIPLDKSLTMDDFNAMKAAMLSSGSIVTEYVQESYIEFLFNVLQKQTKADTQISRASVYQRILMLYSLQLWFQSK